MEDVYGNSNRDGPYRRQPSHFYPSDAQEVAEAERQSRELTNAGFTDATRSSPGQVTQLRSFDPGAEETVFFPRFVGS